MKDKKFLLLNDDSITLFHHKSEKIFFFRDGIESIKESIGKYAALNSKAIFYLLVDRNHQDIREEKLPPLLFWDLMRLLYHKREAWASQGGFHGHRLLKQDGETYLQWVNISRNDPLSSWIEWFNSLPARNGGFFFIALEAGRFLKIHSPKSALYRLLLYKIHSNTARHVVFKGERLLLFRPLIEDNDLKASLHFLSRTYPDIHENLHITNQIPDNKPKSLKNGSSISSNAFIKFLTSQKKPSIFIKKKKTSHYSFSTKTTILFLISIFCLTVFFFYQGFRDKGERELVLTQIEKLKLQINMKKGNITEQNIPALHAILPFYAYLKTLDKQPLKKIERLAIALKKQSLHLEELIWTDEEKTTLDISIVTPLHKAHKMVERLHTLLETLADAFPHSSIHVIEAPFKSAPHETYSFPAEPLLPITRIRIVFS